MTPNPQTLFPAVVRGSSMRPWLPAGTAVLIRPLVRARAGDVAVLRSDDGWLAHRVLASPGRAVRTRGDWTGVADGPHDPTRVLGRIARARIGGRWWSVEGPASRAAGLATNLAVAALKRIGAGRTLSLVSGLRSLVCTTTRQ